MLSTPSKMSYLLDEVPIVLQKIWERVLPNAPWLPHRKAQIGDWTNVICRNPCGGCGVCFGFFSPNEDMHSQSLSISVGSCRFFWRGALISTLFPSVVLVLGMIYPQLGAIEMCRVWRVFTFMLMFLWWVLETQVLVPETAAAEQLSSSQAAGVRGLGFNEPFKMTGMRKSFVTMGTSCSVVLSPRRPTPPSLPPSPRNTQPLTRTCCKMLPHSSALENCKTIYNNVTQRISECCPRSLNKNFPALFTSWPTWSQNGKVVSHGSMPCSWVSQHVLKPWILVQVFPAVNSYLLLPCTRWCLNFIFGFTFSFSEGLLWFTFFLPFYSMTITGNKYLSDVYPSVKFIR